MDFIKNTIGENFGGKAASLSTHQFSLDDVPDQTGKVALVTGGSEGIGYACTHTLLARNASKVFILSVSEDVVKGAKDAVAKDLGQEKADRTVWLQCDLSDWPRVKKAAEEVKQQTSRLDILIENAGRGIMTAQLTDYGIDRHMAVNHFGHVVLTNALMPLLQKTAAKDIVRIVTLASNAHQGAPSDTKFASVEEINKDTGPNGQYGRSKLAMLLYARWLTRTVHSKNANILANAIHPGFVSTKASKEDIHEPYPLAGYAMSVGMEPFKKTNFEGALPALYAATVTSKSGEYICAPAVPEAGTAMSQDEALGDALMRLTDKVLAEYGQ